MSAIDRDAVRAPATVGLNSTETVQMAPTAKAVVQVVADLTKDVALVPVRFSDVSDTDAVPVFLIVTSCAAVVAPTAVDANARLAGETLTVVAAAVAAPESETF